MLQIENIILFCLKQLNGERTVYSVYHLLNGKKSSQTIQDAHLFSLKRYFRILEPLTRERFDEMVSHLQDMKWIQHCGEQRYLLTKSGEILLDKNPQPHYINGWKFHQLTTQFWERMSLFIQVISNYVYQESQYIPIQKNKEAHHWLKVVLQDLKLPRNEIGKVLFSELTNCLEEAKDINPSVLVYRLTGYNQIGNTSLQTAKKLNLEALDYQIEFINILHYLIQTLQRETKCFPLLLCLLPDCKQNNSMTLSSRKTWELLNHGYSLDQIARIRNLKLSTIEDHLVEFSLNMDEFSIDSYVNKEMQNQVLKIARQLGTRQLKLIRKNLETASYFQIRLVLAKYGDW